LIIAGRVVQFVFLLVFSVAIVIGIWLGGRRKFALRRLPALEAIDEAVGRAAEMGRPIHYNPGWYTLDSVEAPQTVAALNILNELAHKAFKANVPIITTLIRPDVIPLVDDIYRNAATSEAKPEMYKPENIRYLSGEQFAYFGGVAKIFGVEHPSASILMGGYMAYSLLMVELGVRHECFQIAGTASWHQIPFFAALADYTLISEELFVAGAYLSQDPHLIGSIFGQDVTRYITLALGLMGIALSAVGSKLFFDFLKL